MIAMNLVFVTGNKDKFADAQSTLSKYGISISQEKLDIDELQSLDGVKISQDKAKKAYQQLQTPLIVNDTVWMIPSLQNFPGPYMKFANDSFTPQDWLDLMSNKADDDRKVVMREIVTYIDLEKMESFYRDVTGEFLFKIAGDDGVPSDKVISFTGDDITIAESRDQGHITTGRDSSIKNSYDLLAEWLIK